MTATVDGNGHQTTISYADNFSDHSCIPSAVKTYAFTTTSTDALGHQTKVAYNTCSRAAVQKQDANDLAQNRPGTQYSYDTSGRPTRTTSADGGSSCTSYQSSTTSLITSDIASGQNHSTSVVLNGFGLVQSQIDESANTEVDFGYDLLGRVQSTTNPHVAGSLSSPSIIYATDGLNRRLGQLQADGTSKLVWQYTGQNIDAFDETGTHHRFTYDAADRLLSAFELGTSTFPLNLETDYIFDALNDLTNVNQIGAPGETPRTRSFTYDWLSRLVTAQNPESGLTCYGTWSGGSVGSGVCQNGYDAKGNLVAKTDARGLIVSMKYDSLDRLTSKTASDGSLSYTYVYDEASHTNGVGRLTSSTNNLANAGVQYSYDPMGRVLQRSVCVPDNCGYIFGGLGTYDLAGDLITSHITTAANVGVTFDSAGRVIGST